MAAAEMVHERRELSTAQKLAKLEKLRNQGVQNLRERTRLAIEILDDREYIKASFSGDWTEAGKAIKRDYLSDIGLTLRQLFHVYNHFTEQQWIEAKFVLADLWDRYCEEKNVYPPPAAPPRPPSKEELAKQEEKIKELEFQVEGQKNIATAKEKQVAELSGKVNEMAARVTDAQQRAEAERQRVEQERQRAEQLKQQAAQVQVKAELALSEVEVLRRRVRELEEENARLQTELAKLKGG